MFIAPESPTRILSAVGGDISSRKYFAPDGAATRCLDNGTINISLLTEPGNLLLRIHKSLALLL